MRKETEREKGQREEEEKGRGRGKERRELLPRLERREDESAFLRRVT